MAISGTGAGISAMGIIFLWSAIKGASVSASLRELISGQQPTGTNVNPIQIAPPTVAQANITAGATHRGNAGKIPRGNQLNRAPLLLSANILFITPIMKRKPDQFGAG